GAALALALVAGGCKARNEMASARDTTTTGAVAATDTTANAPSIAPSSKLTDANIVALLDEANKADSAAGAAAAAKAMSPGATENDQLKDLISKAQPVIQKHLDQAEALQKQLGAKA